MILSNQSRIPTIFLPLVFTFSIIHCPRVSGQVLTDTSFGAESSVVLKDQILQNRKIDIILGGKRNKENLFHSFSKFDISKSKGVLFNPSPTVKNIFARIISKPSSIKGFLGVNGNQNLILINPNGINFDGDVQIGVVGAFLPTTADAVTFNNGDFFNAYNRDFSLSNTKASKVDFNFSDANPISISSAPISFIQQPFIDFIPVPQQKNGLPQGLTNIGNKLIISSGDINLDRGVINAVSGNIEVHAIRKGKLSSDLNTWKTKLQSSNERGDINLKNLSQINIFSSQNAYTQLSSKQLNILSGSYISHFQIGNNKSTTEKNGIDIFSDDIQASSFLNPSSVGINGTIRAGILSTTSVGRGGDINIKTNNLSAALGAGILSQALESGKAGSIKVNASNLVRVNGNYPNTTGFSGIGSIAYNNSKAGNINIIADDLEITDSAAISTYSFTEADNANINITVNKNLTISGLNSSFSELSSRLQSVSISTQKAGDVNVNAKKIFISDGGGIGSASNITGDTGFVEITASELSIEGQISGQSSRIFSAIEPPSDFISQQAAKSLGIKDFPVSGNSKNLKLDIDVIRASNGSEITVRNTGRGDAGNLLINSSKIELINDAQISALTRSGDGGNIDIRAKSISLIGSSVSSSARGSGQGGNIDITTSFAAFYDNAIIEANAQNALAGTINFTTDSAFASPNTQLTTTSNLGPQFDGSIELNIQDSQPVRTVRIASIRKVITDVSRICGFDGNRISVTGNGHIQEITQNPELLTAWSIREKYNQIDGKLFRDIETGEVKPIRPVLGIEYFDNGEFRSIYSPNDSEYIMNLLSSLEEKCDKTRST